MKDYKDLTINSAAEILSESAPVKEATIYDKIDYDQALSNVAYMAGGEHTDNTLMHAYAAALSFAFGIDDTDKVLKDLKHEISIVAPAE